MGFADRNQAIIVITKQIVYNIFFIYIYIYYMDSWSSVEEDQEPDGQHDQHHFAAKNLVCVCGN